MPDLHSCFYILSFKNPCDCHTPISLSWARLPAKPGWGPSPGQGGHTPPLPAARPPGMPGKPPLQFPYHERWTRRAGPQDGPSSYWKACTRGSLLHSARRNCGAKCVRSRTPSHSRPGPPPRLTSRPSSSGLQSNREFLSHSWRL